jgi:hypothetical protein
MRTYNPELQKWEQGRGRFDILRLLIQLDDLQLALATHAQFYTDSGAAESARDRLPVSFLTHVEELYQLARKVSDVSGVLWEESGLKEECHRLTPLYRDLLISVYGVDEANNILMDLATRRSDV